MKFPKDVRAAVRRFNRSYTNLIGVVDRHILSSPFSLTEARVLYEVHHGNGVTTRQLKNLLAVDEGYMSHVVEKLVSQGLVEKRKSDGDKRITLLNLSSRGRERFQELDSRSEEAVGRLTDGLSPEKSRRLTEAMDCILQILGSREEVENGPR